MSNETQDRIAVLKGILIIKAGALQRLYNKVDDRVHMLDGYDFMGPAWNKEHDRLLADVNHIDKEIHLLKFGNGDVRAGDGGFWDINTFSVGE